MSPLDDTDVFRSCDFDVHDGVNSVFTFAEDSVHRYSRAQIQRAKDARQRIDQRKEKQEAVENKKNIEITISEDLGDGQFAKLDASLKLLGGDELKLLIPSDELEDDEIHIIEISTGNQALQDYQRQLMLLEQQNKKRLLMARQEQDAFQRAQPLRSSGYARVFEGKPTTKDKIQVSSVQKPSGDLSLRATLFTLEMPATRADQHTAPAAKRQKRCHGARDKSHKAADSGVSNGDDSNAQQAGPVERLPPHFDLLYKISCNGTHLDCHPVPAFRDVPVLDAFDSRTSYIASRSHLNGTVPVFDLAAFMDNDKDDIAFVIIRTVECSEASVMMARANGTLRWTEAIYMKSKISKIALQQTATCYFQTPPEDNYPPPYRQTSSDLKKPLYEQNQLNPADLFLFHHYHSLAAYAVEHPESKDHIDALLDYVRNQYSKEFTDAENHFARGQVTRSCLLFLFKPNDLILTGTYGRPAAFVLQEWPKLSSDGWVTLNCWSFQTDGSGFARKQSVLKIPPIELTDMDIQKLVAYPLRFAPPKLREMIRIRGEKQWKLRNATQITYKGWNVKRDQFFPDARFMIDHTVYRKMHEFAQAFQFDKPTTTHPFDRMPAYLSADQEPSEISFLLMPPDIHGFYLNEKKWIKLFVDCVHDVSWNKKAYERLVLPPQTKDLIQALVTVRTSQRGVKQGLGVAGKRTDITGGKGNGLIMLLHGGPGTGKTLTAESVAEIAEMPLYRVTCGDIGTSAEAVEKYLNTVLHLGKTWNCVLLLDEADVFLEERSMADLKRNSLVSVFLRILEYYDGILILTSNRVGMFDEAFKSRIQVALHYENLNRSARKKIWQNFLDMLEEDEEDVNFDEIKYHLDDLAGKELNGRQIRNVLTTARQLALFKNERLDWKHLEQALSVSSDFSEYLKRMQGHTDDQRARDIGLR